MNATIYSKMVDLYVKQCGTNTDLWLQYVLSLKWEMAVQGGI